MADNINTSDFELKNHNLLFKIALNCTIGNEPYGTHLEYILSSLNSNDLNTVMKHEKLLINEVFKNMPKNIDPEKSVASYVAEAIGDDDTLMKITLYHDTRFCPWELIKNACMVNNLNIAKYIFNRYDDIIIVMHGYEYYDYANFKLELNSMLHECKRKGFDRVIKWYTETIIPECDDIMKKHYHEYVEKLDNKFKNN